MSQGDEMRNLEHSKIEFTPEILRKFLNPISFEEVIHLTEN